MRGHSVADEPGRVAERIGEKSRGNMWWSGRSDPFYQGGRIVPRDVLVYEEVHGSSGFRAFAPLSATIGPVLVVIIPQPITPTTMSTQKEQPNKNNPNNSGLGQLNKGTEGQGNTTGQQPGTQRQGAENTQMGDDRKPGTLRQGAENTQMGDDRKPGSQHQGAENTRMGDRSTDKAPRTDGSASDRNKPVSDPMASDDDVNKDHQNEENTDLAENEEGTPRPDEANVNSGARK